MNETDTGCAAAAKSNEVKPTGSTCKTEDAVIELLRDRGEVGRKKYGVSMDRNDLTMVQWLQHLQEELGDALQYAERVKAASELLARAVTIIDQTAGAAAAVWVRDFRDQFGRVPAEPKPSLGSCFQVPGLHDEYTIRHHQAVTMVVDGSAFTGLLAVRKRDGRLALTALTSKPSEYTFNCVLL